MIKITRLQKIKEDDVDKRIVIGVTYTDDKTNKSAYIDWTADISEVGETKKDLLNYIKGYLTRVTNQSEIDEATQRQTDLQTEIEKNTDEEKIATLTEHVEAISVPEEQTILKSLQNRVKQPEIKFEELDLLDDNEKEITIK